MSHAPITYAYVRVSTDDQTTENQLRQIMEKYPYARPVKDDAISGMVPAIERPGLSALLGQVGAKEGDTVVVAAIDRLGRNTIDVLSTVEAFKERGVTVVSLRENFDLSSPAGYAMLTMLAAMAQLERQNLKARQLAGLKRARAEGKNLGRIKTINDADVANWRRENNMSIAQTAQHFGISPASVKRACAMSTAIAH